MIQPIQQITQQNPAVPPEPIPDSVYIKPKKIHFKDLKTFEGYDQMMENWHNLQTESKYDVSSVLSSPIYGAGLTAPLPANVFNKPAPSLNPPTRTSISHAMDKARNFEMTEDKIYKFEKPTVPPIPLKGVRTKKPVHYEFDEHNNLVKPFFVEPPSKPGTSKRAPRNLNIPSFDELKYRLTRRKCLPKPGEKNIDNETRWEVPYQFGFVGKSPEAQNEHIPPASATLQSSVLSTESTSHGLNLSSLQALSTELQKDDFKNMYQIHPPIYPQFQFHQVVASSPNIPSFALNQHQDMQSVLLNKPAQPIRPNPILMYNCYQNGFDGTPSLVQNRPIPQTPFVDI